MINETEFVFWKILRYLPEHPALAQLIIFVSKSEIYFHQSHFYLGKNYFIRHLFCKDAFCSLIPCM